MTKLFSSCSIEPNGVRGFLVKSERKNPRFKAGEFFQIKDRTSTHILVKFKRCNSIFAIANESAPDVLGATMVDFLQDIDTKKSEALKMILTLGRELLKERES